MRATRVARSCHLQVIIMHASQVCSRHSFGLPLTRMNGIHRKQLDYSHLDLLWSLRIWSRVFGTSVKWNLCEARRSSNSVFIFHRCRPHSVTFGFLLFPIIYWSLSHSIVIFTIIKNKSAELRRKRYLTSDVWQKLYNITYKIRRLITLLWCQTSDNSYMTADVCCHMCYITVI